MGWRITNVEEQKKLFIDAYLARESSVRELCDDFEISRKTAYKWIGRYQECGFEGLKDRSRARYSQVETDSELIHQILRVKTERVTWGSKKILAYLENKNPDNEWPSSTTIDNILLKNGFERSRKTRRKLPSKAEPLSASNAPNDIWCMDFKGWFKTKDAVKCDPFTISDSFSRFIFHCSKLPFGNTQFVWDALEKCFYEYGLPTRIRHDNGPPFATCGVGRLSKLSLNLIKAGVTPEWIAPGKPYQNGRHERMHRTLKEEAIDLKLTLKEQEMKFREYLNHYNFERPHQSLGQKTPGSVYAVSPRKWNGKLTSPEYDSESKIVRVRSSGQISWYGKEIFISKLLRDEYVGLKENEDGNWDVRYGPVSLGLIDGNFKLMYSFTNKRVVRPYKQKIF